MRKLFLFLLISLPALVHAQNVTNNGKTKQPAPGHGGFAPISTTHMTLTGNVVLGIDETRIKCDSAVIDIITSTIAAYGNVHISPNPDLQLSSSYTSINYANKKGIGLNMLHSDKQIYQ